MKRTDWDRYYRQPFAAARLTRRITGRFLVECLRRHLRPVGEGLVLAELGGANSCFFERVHAAIRPREYHVIDLNQYGLDRMRERLGARNDVCYHRADVLDLRLPLQADAVFSVGLVEHFPPEETGTAVRAHLQLLRPGGVCLVAFPTPTLPYRATRRVAELLGFWRFPDERPLKHAEIAAALAPGCTELEHSILWSIVLTQMFLVARKLAPQHGTTAS